MSPRYVNINIVLISNGIHMRNNLYSITLMIFIADTCLLTYFSI